MFRASPIHRPETSLVKLILIRAIDPARVGFIFYALYDNVLCRIIAFLPLITCARCSPVKVGLGVATKSYSDFFIQHGGTGHDIISSRDAI